jgi:HK97 family phage major capsid protein
LARLLLAVDELVDMQDGIDAGYLEADSQPVYMMSQSLRNTLLKQTADSGNLLYPEIKQGQLLGLPLVINVDMTANAGDVGVVCGSVKRAVLVQSVNPNFIRSVERYAENNQTLYGMVHRLGVKLIDSNAVTALKLHAA